MREQKRKRHPGDLTECELDKIKHLIKEDVDLGVKGRTKYPRGKHWL
jgi:hypothetical protein